MAEKEMEVKDMKNQNQSQCFNMKKYLVLFAALMFYKFTYSQKIQLLNDSNALKKEIFEKVINSAIENKKKRIYRFRDFVGSFKLMDYKDNSVVKNKLAKHLPKNSINEIFSLKKQIIQIQHGRMYMKEFHQIL